MATHEYELRDYELPAAGRLDPEFSREILRHAEECGFLHWTGTGYERTPRATLIEVGRAIFAAAEEIEITADPENVLREILFTRIAPTGWVPDTLPEEWR
jgi:hypothetical protein